MNGDVVLGCAALALAVAYYLAAAAIPDTLLSDTIGPRGLPKIYAVVLASLAIVLLIQSLLRGTRANRNAPPSPLPHPSSSFPLPPVLLRVAGMLIIGVVYVVVVPWLGYVPTIAVLIAGTTYYQGGVMSGRVAITAVAGALFLWLLFVALLDIPQPAGIWPW